MLIMHVCVCVCVCLCCCSVFYTSTKQPHPPPLGHETIAFSVGGRPADLNKGGIPTYITVKRGVLYGHNTAITELCLIMPGKVSLSCDHHVI